MNKHFGILLLLVSLLAPPRVSAAEEATLDSNFSTPGGGMTDQQAADAKNFTHTGYRQRVMDQKCAEKDINCDPNQNGGFMEFLEMNMGKAYAMLFGGMALMGGGMKLKTNEAPGADGKKPEDKTDYCLMAATGWEAVAMLAQTALNSNVEQETANIKDAQLRSLEALKKKHKARQKTALMQAVAYSGVTACYGAMAFTGISMKDPMLYVKWGGAAALAGFYIYKHIKEGQSADKVQEIIDSLPDPGDCNPWTGTSCFCKEETSAKLYPTEYQEVCVLKLKAGDTQTADLGCYTQVDGKMQIDASCKCKQTKSCYNKQVQAFMPSFNLGTNSMASPNKAFDLLGEEYNPAKLASYSTSANAHALKALSKAKVPAVKLTDAQKKNALQFSGVLPPNLAAIAATAPAGGPPSGLGVGAKANIDNLSKAHKEKIASEIKGNYVQGSGYSSGNDDAPGFVPPVMPGQEPNNETETLEFAQKAVDGADVSNSKDTPIFDIISNRYRKSYGKVDSAEMKDK